MSGRAQTVRARTVGASYGDAFLAALAVGDVKRETIREWNPVAAEIAADPANAGVYRRQYAVFRDLYPATKALMHRLDG
jgi:xylulokinase